jgi:hypothetical protein
MARNDGRIEPGQKLSSAISARAWNRAQQAADVVLGAGAGTLASGGIPSPSCLSFPMKIAGQSMLTGNKFPPGTVVRLTGLETKYSATSASVTSNLSPPYEGYMQCDVGSATIHEPYTSLNLYVDGSTGDPWGVTAAGGTIGDVVPVIVRGVAPVRIRLIDGNGFAAPTVRRATAETVDALRGVLETTSCACDNAARVLGLAAFSEADGGPENAKCKWGVVIL